MATRILVAEPQERIADAFSRALRARGFEAFTASNERDCMRHMCESAPDVVVLEPDAMGTWGRNVLAKGGRIPLLVVSRFSPHDHVQDEDVQWLTKPIATEQLVDAVALATCSQPCKELSSDTNFERLSPQE